MVNLRSDIKKGMTYQETLKFLFSQLPVFQRIGKAAYKANLDNTLALDEYFGHPHREYKCIHIAGTNGKGSVAHMLASVLQEAGYKTGLYTSPHLKDFTERIRVNGKQAEKDFVIRFVEEHGDSISHMRPSFFEMTVAMAFDYFRQKKIDVAVVETGLGGRLDSTNIIKPELSVITNIGNDHKEFLGSTLSGIAAEKAGIIKRGVPVVIGETLDDIKSVFINKATEQGSEIFFADSNYSIDYSLGTMKGLQRMNITHSGKLFIEAIECDLMGSYQLKNIKTAIQSIEVLRKRGFKIREEHIREGLKTVVANTGLRGRWELLNVSPYTVCDTAHNLEGLTEVTKQIKNTAYKKLHIVLGMLSGKEEQKILKLFPEDARYYFTQPNIPRALPAEKLAGSAARAGLRGEVIAPVSLAYEAARRNAGPKDMIFIGGSTFVVAEVL